VQNLCVSDCAHRKDDPWQEVQFAEVNERCDFVQVHAGNLSQHCGQRKGAAREQAKDLTLLLLSVQVQSTPIARDSHGRIRRSPAVRREFERTHPCPSTGLPYGRCPNWVVDHVVALECGGPDSVDNMQWQTVTDAKIKDRTERLCRLPR
jgi:hypothetical protein